MSHESSTSRRRGEAASRWWANTKGIWRVSQWLGHGSIAVTQRYLALTDTTGQAADMADKLGHRKNRKAG